MTQSGSLAFDSYGLADYFVITDDAAGPQLRQRGFRNPISATVANQNASIELKAVESFRGDYVDGYCFSNDWLIYTALSGIASVVFALLVMMNPAAGALTIAWLIGWYALFLGAMLVMLSIKLHNIRS
jgi:hypothetical protein